MKETFHDIIGLGAAGEHLQNALRTGAVSHAYILYGEKGSGRRLLAGVFAAALQCETRAENPALTDRCGTCPSCIRYESDAHPDIITVTHEKKSKSDKRTDLSVDDIRRVVSDVPIRPYGSPYKVYILPDADKMTPQAQNALLKTLEEPPAYAVLLLLATSLSAFLPTVLSRCVALKISPLPEEQVEQYLTAKCGEDRQHARIVSRFAAGSIGRAKELAGSPDFAAMYDAVVELLKNLPRKDITELLGFAKEYGKDRTAMPEVLGLMRSWYRDVLFYKETGRPAGLIFVGEVQYIIEAAVRTPAENIGRILAAFDTAERQMKYNTNLELILEVLLLDLKKYG